MKNRTRNVSQFSTFVALVVASLFLASTALASVPVSITQQGRILDGDGEPLTGNHTLEFALYDSPTGGVILWSDSVTTRLNEHGVYSVTLGNSAQPIDAELLRDGDVYLGMTAGESEMTPRLELTAVPFAAMSEVALSVADGSVTSSAFAPGAVTSDVIDSVAWDQITGVPSEVTDSTDTLADLSCAGSQVAIHDGSAWSCGDLPQPVTYDGTDFAVSSQSCTGSQVAVGISDSGQLICDDQQDTTYSAGEGLALSGDSFSLDSNYFNDFLQCSGDDCPVLEPNSLYTTGDGNIFTRDDGRIGAGTNDPTQRLHVVSDTHNAGVLIQHPTADVAWATGVGLSTHHYRFMWYPDGPSETAIFRGYIDRDTAEFVSQSDQRTKQDIEYVDNVLDRVLALRPAMYSFNHVGENPRRTIGLMAQEVMEVFPELVHFDEDSKTHALAYSNFGVLAVQAIDEQQQIINEQEALIKVQAQELEQLRSQQASFEERLSALEKR